MLMMAVKFVLDMNKREFNLITKLPNPSEKKSQLAEEPAKISEGPSNRKFRNETETHAEK